METKLDEIKLGRIYTKDGKTFYRGIGWMGKSVVYEEVLLYTRLVPFFGRRVDIKKKRGRLLYKLSLNQFIVKMRIPTPEEVDAYLEDK